ncbi:MAG: histidine triad nucleotide-binding protein [Anaerovoracaceae bacterium]|jgi:histidine triad (HIT) family protein
MSDCIFCKIANKEIPANIVYEDDDMVVFHDLAPQAPVHVLMIPKKHMDSLNHVGKEDEETMGRLIGKVKEIADNLGLMGGYRLICNCGEDGMQTVKHIHFHLLGKRKMLWPPG